MATNILMPALSPTMEEGKLSRWLVKEGDTIKSGTILAEIETDKATMEFEAVDEGRLGKILVPEGSEGVKVNSPIATLLADGESASIARALAIRMARRGRRLRTVNREGGRDVLMHQGAHVPRSHLHARSDPARDRAVPARHSRTGSEDRAAVRGAAGAPAIAAHGGGRRDPSGAA